MKTAILCPNKDRSPLVCVYWSNAVLCVTAPYDDLSQDCSCQPYNFDNNIIHFMTGTRGWLCMNMSFTKTPDENWCFFMIKAPEVKFTVWSLKKRTQCFINIKILFSTIVLITGSVYNIWVAGRSQCIHYKLRTKTKLHCKV